MANIKEHTSSASTSPNRRYWVVSPNVRYNEASVGEWRQASVREQAAFMGWAPNDQEHGKIGPKFAGEAERGITDSDVILIARRHHRAPEIVGFGVVRGESAKSLKGLKTPDTFGSLRKLNPFIAWSQPPPGVPLIEVLQFTKAMVQLHPDQNKAHKRVCDWMDRHLGRKSQKKSKINSEPKKKRKPTNQTTFLVARPENHQLDYKVRTKAQLTKAKKLEADLLESYASWLKRQERTLMAAKYKSLWCDGYEEKTGNLIEAKSSATREHIRMAVGQLLDYSFQGESELGVANKAILLPTEPDPELVKWLQPLKISVVWREGKKFLDNANGWFS